MFDNLTLEQLQERARLNALRGISVSRELRDEIARRETAGTGTKFTTRTIAGHSITLLEGVRYRASRPMAVRNRSHYPVTIAPMAEEAPSYTVQGLSYDESNRLLKAFNNGATSFDGRVW